MREHPNWNFSRVVNILEPLSPKEELKKETRTIRLTCKHVYHPFSHWIADHRRRPDLLSQVGSFGVLRFKPLLKIQYA